MSYVIRVGGQNFVVDNLDVNLDKISPEYQDPFLNFKVASPNVLAAVNQSKKTKSLFYSVGQVSGTNGTFSTNADASLTTLSVGTTQSLVRLRSKYSGLYQTGIGAAVDLTFVLGTGVSGVIKRVGYFWGNNGFFLEQNGTTLSFVLRSSSSGSLVETRINQANWNVNKCDGTGNVIYDADGSIFDLDVTKAQILGINYQWLGVGLISGGFNLGNKLAVAHRFWHPNLIDSTYMRTSDLFLTYEIEQTAVTGGTAASMKAICAAFINYGNEAKTGTDYSIARALTSTFNTSTANTVRILGFFRLNPDNINSRVLATNISITLATTCVYYISLVRNPTYTGTHTHTWTSKTDKSIQYDFTGSNTLALTNLEDGEQWRENGDSVKNSGTTFTFNIDSVDYLGSFYNDIPEIYAVCIQCDTANVVVSSLVVKFSEQI